LLPHIFHWLLLSRIINSETNLFWRQKDGNGKEFGQEIDQQIFLGQINLIVEIKSGGKQVRNVQNRRLEQELSVQVVQYEQDGGFEIAWHRQESEYQGGSSEIRNLFAIGWFKDVHCDEKRRGGQAYRIRRC
jgi:hypothetical protein